MTGSAGDDVRSTGPVIEVAGVTFAYDRGAPETISQLTLDVHRGDFVGILGPNGAGKSTLMRLIAGLHSPRRGSVRVLGGDVASLTRDQIARRVAWVPQREELAFGFRVRDVVAMGRAPHTGWFGVLRETDTNAVSRAMDACDCMQFAERPFDELSGGEQKRVLVARALAQQTPVLLLDEPVASVDIQHQLALCELLARGVAAKNYTAVAVMHDLNLAAQFCTRVVFLREGRLVAQGPVHDVMTYRTIRETFDADVYVGENEINRTRYFVPMRATRPEG